MSVAPPMNASHLDALVEAANVTERVSLNVPYVISEVLVAVVAVIGNALTITVFVIERRLRRRTNYYIVSLALADLLVGLFGIPFAILTSVGLPRPLWACLFMLSTLLILCTVSIFCLLAVSVDRYWAILHPLPYSRVMTARIARRIILVCWVAGTLVGLLPMMGWYNTSHPYEEVCFFVEVMSYDYLVFIYFATIALPGLLMAFFYTHIYTVVLKQVKLSVKSEHGTLRQIAAQKPQGDTASVGTEGSQRQRSNIFRSQRRGQVSESSRYDPHQTSTSTNLPNQVTHSSRREVKAAKSLSIIVLFFMISWFPLYTINCVQAFCTTCTMSPALMFFTITLTHLNSAINPFLYAYHMKDFRLALKTFIMHHILRRPVDPDTAFNRSQSSLYHHSAVHRINVSDVYHTNLHTPRSHNSPASGSPLPGMSADGIKSRSPTVGSIVPWDSCKALSTSVSFPSSPAFTTLSSAAAHANDLLPHPPRAATLNSHSRPTSTKDTHDTADDTPQPLLASSITLSSATLHNNDPSPTGQQPCLTSSVVSGPLLAGTADVANVSVTDNHCKLSLGPGQYEKPPARSVPEATMQVGDIIMEPKEENNINSCPESLQETPDMTKLETEAVNSINVHAMSDTTLTAGTLSANANTEYARIIKQEGSRLVWLTLPLFL